MALIVRPYNKAESNTAIPMVKKDFALAVLGYFDLKKSNRFWNYF
jgi:hypothetical protein